MSKLKIDKYSIKWDYLYIWLNPFMKGTSFRYIMWLNVKIIYTFFKCNIKRFYRWVFRIPIKPLTKEEKLELARTLRKFLDDVKPIVKAINTEAEYAKTKEQWKKYQKEEKEKR